MFAFLMIKNYPENIISYFVQDTTIVVGRTTDSSASKTVQRKNTDSSGRSEIPARTNSVNEVLVNQPASSKTILGSNPTSSSSDTVFQLSGIGSFDYILTSRVLNHENLAFDALFSNTEFVSKSQSEHFNRFSGRVFIETPNNQNYNVYSTYKSTLLSAGSSWWLFGLIITISIVFVWFRNYYEKFFGLLFLGSVNIREAERFFSSKTSHYKRILWITTGLLICSFGLIIFNYLSIASSVFVSSINSYLLIVAAIIGYLAYRNILLSLFSIVSNLRDFFSSLSFHNFIYNFVITLTLLFFGVLSNYLPYEWRLFPLYGCLFIVIILLIFRSIRTLRLFIFNRFSIFYWILYFCALELLPLAFLIYGFKRLVIIA